MVSEPKLITIRDTSMDELQQDLRHAARVLRYEPALSASAILTVALAVGVTTAVFSVLYGVLLRPLPYPGADRLVTVWEEHPGGRPLVAEQLNALLATVGAGLLAGILPALRASRAKPGEALRAGGGRTAAGGGERLRALLLGLEAAIGVVLLIGAALLGRSFAALASVDAGYEPQNLLAARIHLTATPGRADAGGEFVRTLMERLQSAPGVVAAGAGNMAPLGDPTQDACRPRSTCAAGHPPGKGAPPRPPRPPPAGGPPARPPRPGAAGAGPSSTAAIVVKSNR